MLKNIQKQLNLIYLNNDEHSHMDRSNLNTDLLDVAFISPNLAKHDIQFQIGDDLGSDHLPIEVSIDAPPHRNSSTNHIKYKFDQTDREVFESTLEAALGSEDFSVLISTSVDKAIPKSKTVRSESNPISYETIALIEEKCRLRRQYSQNKDPAVKTHINQLQKQFEEELGVETKASWEKFCNSVSLMIQESLGAKSRTSSSLRVSTTIHDDKVTKTNSDKA